MTFNWIISSVVARTNDTCYVNQVAPYQRQWLNMDVVGSLMKWCRAVSKIVNNVSGWMV